MICDSCGREILSSDSLHGSEGLTWHNSCPQPTSKWPECAVPSSREQIRSVLACVNNWEFMKRSHNDPILHHVYRVARSDPSRELEIMIALAVEMSKQNEELIAKLIAARAGQPIIIQCPEGSPIGGIDVGHDAELKPELLGIPAKMMELPENPNYTYARQRMMEDRNG